METVKILVECNWVKNDTSPGFFCGGYNIVSCKGHPQINGGFGTWDFAEWTVESIKQRIKETYQDYSCVKGKKLEVIVTVTKDERISQSLDSFF